MFTTLFNGRVRLRAARAILERLAPLLDVRFCVRLWDGAVVPLGSDADPACCIAISGPGVISSLLRRPTLDNLIQHYASGRIDFQGTDLFSFWELARARRSKVRVGDLGVGWLARKLAPFLFFPADRSNVVHAAAHEGRRTAASSNATLIRFHYDVSNEFYRLFLDEEMIYTCAYFTDWNNSLEQAQLDKLDMICRKLRLRPGESLLDVGCGWGGLVCYAAQNYGVRAHGVTLSVEQHRFAEDRIRRLGLQDRVTVECRDYITVSGVYDKIASIGLTEHIGIANYPAYFGKLNSLLHDRGLLLNHAIARRAKANKARFRKSRPEQRALQKYIFPGGQLDHIGHTVETMETCQFEIHDVENWRPHYALTCKIWAQRLAARSAEAIRLVGPEVYRMWLAYLAGVSFTFTDGTSHLFQVVASKHAGKGLSRLPATRADLYARPWPSERVGAADGRDVRRKTA